MRTILTFSWVLGVTGGDSCENSTALVLASRHPYCFNFLILLYSMIYHPYILYYIYDFRVPKAYRPSGGQSQNVCIFYPTESCTCYSATVNAINILLSYRSQTSTTILCRYYHYLKYLLRVVSCYSIPVTTPTQFPTCRDDDKLCYRVPGSNTRGKLRYALLVCRFRRRNERAFSHPSP